MAEESINETRSGGFDGFGSSISSAASVEQLFHVLQFGEPPVTSRRVDT